MKVKDLRAILAKYDDQDDVEIVVLSSEGYSIWEGGELKAHKVEQTHPHKRRILLIGTDEAVNLAMGGS